MPTYLKSESCGFRFTGQEWDEFSNFGPIPNPILAGAHSFRTSEALYQAAKFASRPDIQRRIAEAGTPREAARIGRIPDPGPDAGWNDQRIDVMRWVIRMKREANPGIIEDALRRTGHRPIVEISTRDPWWGARPAGDAFEGRNVLGRLWMELRHHIRTGDPLALASAWGPRIRVGPLAGDMAQHRLPGRTATPLVYAGIGARATPGPVLEQMRELAAWLAERGWHLRSGGAAGADSAFASAAPSDKRTQFLPWRGFRDLGGPDSRVATPEQAARGMALAARLHPAWERCSTTARKFHARNASIILGPNGDTPVNAVLCWTGNGRIAGGTGMAIRMANAHGIPVINLATTTPHAARQRLDAIRARCGVESRAANEPEPAAAARIRAQPEPRSQSRDTEPVAMSDLPSPPTAEDGRNVPFPDRISEVMSLYCDFTETSEVPDIVPLPGERDALEERLAKATGTFFALAATHPRILDGLEELANQRARLKPNGFVSEAFLEHLERLASDPSPVIEDPGLLSKPNYWQGFDETQTGPHPVDESHIVQGTRIAIGGARHGASRDIVFAMLDQVLDKYPDVVLVHGGAAGPQDYARDWAITRKRPELIRHLEGDDAAAISRRDKAILDANPVGVIDFSPPDKPSVLAQMARARGFKVVAAVKTVQDLKRHPAHARSVARQHDRSAGHARRGLSV